MRVHGLPAVIVFLLGCALLAAVVGHAKKKKLPARPLDLNYATVEELQQLPGVGPTTAKAIVRFREKSGPFRRVEDLLAVRGITKRKLEQLRPYVFVEKREGKSESWKAWEHRIPEAAELSGFTAKRVQHATGSG